MTIEDSKAASQNKHPLNDLLTQAQWEAVSHTKGPLLVLAGAGSGKTRVITYRIFYLVQKLGIFPSRILAVTFTNKAASEMKDRLGNLIGEQARRMWISTFHSACVRILRRDIDKLDMPPNFLIFDADDQLRLIKRCFTQSKKNVTSLSPRSVLSAISKAKNDLVSATDYEKMANNFFQKRISEFYTMYEDALRQNTALDFDDLILFTVKLFQKKTDILENYQDRWEYIMVDEYQDTNLAQSTLLDLLAAKNQNLCVVGDDDQSIYRWRGAEVKNILRFEKRYPKARVIRLEQNYRSTQKILKVAEAVIEKNLNRKGKKLWTENEPGEPVVLYKAKDEHNEASYVSRTIKSLCKEDFKNLKNFSVLYRVNAQSRVLEEELRKRGIPYSIIGGIRFYERREIKDCLAYLRAINSPKDNISLLRIINLPPRGIGKGTLDKLTLISSNEGISIFEAIGKALEDEIFPVHINNRLNTFYKLLTDLRKMAPQVTITQILNRVLDETKYIFYLQKEHSEQAKTRVENVKELLSATSDFEAQSDESTLSSFLDHVALITDTDSYQGEKGAVTLMTLHSAKGLEFPVVFITGMEQGVFPHSKSLGVFEELEEERRLCYVGMTRAKKRLYLSCVEERLIFGGRHFNAPSIFLEDIPKDCLKIENEEGPEEVPSLSNHNPCPYRNVKSKTKYGQSIPAKDNIHTGQIRVGAVVSHSQWGKGNVLKIEGEGDIMKLLIDFRGIKKKIMARYVNLEILSY